MVSSMHGMPTYYSMRKRDGKSSDPAIGSRIGWEFGEDCLHKGWFI